jgi:hypothetical protein
MERDTSFHLRLISRNKIGVLGASPQRECRLARTHQITPALGVDIVQPSIRLLPFEIATASLSGVF